MKDKISGIPKLKSNKIDQINPYATNVVYIWSS